MPALFVAVTVMVPEPAAVGVPLSTRVVVSKLRALRGGRSRRRSVSAAPVRRRDGDVGDGRADRAADGVAGVVGERWGRRDSDPVQSGYL